MDNNILASPDSNILVPPQDIQLDMNGITPQRKNKKGTNPCASFVRQQMQCLYEEQELANGRIGGGKRNYMGSVQDKDALSPNRLNRIICAAKRKFKEDFESMGNLNEVVNAKCRQVRYKLDKKLKVS